MDLTNYKLYLTLKKYNMKSLLFIAICSLLFSCASLPTEASSQKNYKAMVVSARKEASEIGIEIMKKGGNAFDAMVATELSLAVCYPQAGNIAGGGFMVYRLSNGTKGSLDFREKAPINAYKDMYLDDDGNIIKGKSTESISAVGVPGTIAGIFDAHAKFGSLPIEEILKPIIHLAENGYVVTQKHFENINDYKDIFINKNGKNSLYAKPIKVGDTIKNIAFANTLKRIAKNGKNEFYKGETSKILIDYITSKGGIITAEDLQKYKAVWRKPITFKFKDFNIISMSPPSSGGITLAQILKMIEPFHIEQHKHNSTEYIQLLTEAERRAYADRNYYLGDPDFINIPVDSLLNDKYLSNRMSNFNWDKATSSKDIMQGEISLHESTETTHYSIVDKYGNAVAVTTTLNDHYGSKWFCEELGIFLNNEMDDFSAKAGAPNLYGLIGSSANSIAPQKRMLSSMTPTIVEKDNKLFMVLGSPGGSTIITSVLQVFLNAAVFNYSMQDAVNAPRFHHQWLPDEIIFEPNSFNSKTLEELKEKDYIIKEKNNRVIGKVDAILVNEKGFLQGGADKRGDDAAVGF